MKQSEEIFSELTESLDLLTKVNSYMIEVGVLDDSEKVKDEEGKEYPFNYAALMAVHEFGAKGGIIPARPALQITVDAWKNGKDGTYLDKFLENALKNVIEGNWTETDIGRQLDNLCVDIRNYASEGIRHNKLGLQPNAESTIERKSKKDKISDIPLLDTGALARHIVCRWKKN